MFSQTATAEILFAEAQKRRQFRKRRVEIREQEKEKKRIFLFRSGPLENSMNRNHECTYVFKRLNKAP